MLKIKNWKTTPDKLKKNSKLTGKKDHQQEKAKENNATRATKTTNCSQL